MAASSQRPKPRASRAQLTTQFTTVVGMSLTLFMVGMLGMAALFGQWASQKLQQHVHVQVHLQRELSQAQIDGARLAVTADSAVAQASYLDPRRRRPNWNRSSANPSSNSSDTCRSLPSSTWWSGQTMPNRRPWPKPHPGSRSSPGWRKWCGTRGFCRASTTPWTRGSQRLPWSAQCACWWPWRC